MIDRTSFKGAFEKTSIPPRLVCRGRVVMTGFRRAGPAPEASAESMSDKDDPNNAPKVPPARKPRRPRVSSATTGAPGIGDGEAVGPKDIGPKPPRARKP